jgi:hypothetical protein
LKAASTASTAAKIKRRDGRRKSRFVVKRAATYGDKILKGAKPGDLPVEEPATMQQMVARQVDLGTYAGQSFVTGYHKGQLVAIAQIEKVGKTARVMARKELNIKGGAAACPQDRQSGGIFDWQHFRRHHCAQGRASERGL